MEKTGQSIVEIAESNGISRSYVDKNIVKILKSREGGEEFDLIVKKRGRIHKKTDEINMTISKIFQSDNSFIQRTISINLKHLKLFFAIKHFKNAKNKNYKKKVQTKTFSYDFRRTYWKWKSIFYIDQNDFRQ